MRQYSDIGQYENGYEKGFHYGEGLYFVAHWSDKYYINKDVYDSINSELDCRMVIAECLRRKADMYASDVHSTT